MGLASYFEERSGIGILSTADANGRVDAAIYARPHVMDDGTLAMIMRDHLTHRNLQENPYAVYLFLEQGPGYQGRRLYLKKIHEDQNPRLLRQLMRPSLTSEEDQAKGPKFMVYFVVENDRQLVGDESPQLRLKSHPV